jgi:hypothetical protein
MLNVVRSTDFMVIEKRPKHKKKAQAAAKLGSFYTTPCHLIKKAKE